MRPALALLLAFGAIASTHAVAESAPPPPPPMPAASAASAPGAASSESGNFCARFAGCTEADFARWRQNATAKLPGDSVSFKMTTAADGRITAIDPASWEKRGNLLAGLRKSLVGRMNVGPHVAGGKILGVLRADAQGRLADIALRTFFPSSSDRQSLALPELPPITVSGSAPSPVPAGKGAAAGTKAGAGSKPAAVPAATSKAAPAAAEEEGKRSPESILRVIRQHIGGFRYSYNKALRDNPGMGGKLSLKFTISPPGDIVAISVVESNTGNAGLDEEIKDKARRMKFEAIEKGNVTITYAFVLDKQ